MGERERWSKILHQCQWPQKISFACNGGSKRASSLLGDAHLSNFALLYFLRWKKKYIARALKLSFRTSFLPLLRLRTQLFVLQEPYFLQKKVGSTPLHVFATWTIVLQNTHWGRRTCIVVYLRCDGGTWSSHNPWLPESRGHNTWETNTTRPIAVDPGRLSIESRRTRVVQGV